MSKKMIVVSNNYDQINRLLHELDFEYECLESYRYLNNNYIYLYNLTYFNETILAQTFEDNNINFVLDDNIANLEFIDIEHSPDQRDLFDYLFNPNEKIISVIID